MKIASSSGHLLGALKRSEKPKIRGVAERQISPPQPKGDCVVMSLRGSETTEAISHFTEKKEIAAPPSVARNDKEGL